MDEIRSVTLAPSFLFALDLGYFLRALIGHQRS